MPSTRARRGHRAPDANHRDVVSHAPVMLLEGWQLRERDRGDRYRLARHRTDRRSAIGRRAAVGMDVSPLAGGRGTGRRGDARDGNRCRDASVDHRRPRGREQRSSQARSCTEGYDDARDPRARRPSDRRSTTGKRSEPRMKRQHEGSKPSARLLPTRQRRMQRLQPTRPPRTLKPSGTPSATASTRSDRIGTPVATRRRERRPAGSSVTTRS